MSELKEVMNVMQVSGERIPSGYYKKSEADKVIAHHKYKRCLAMARWCRTSSQYDESVGAFKYRDWYWKWCKRWLELAEKFKPNKEVVCKN